MPAARRASSVLSYMGIVDSSTKEKKEKDKKKDKGGGATGSTAAGTNGGKNSKKSGDRDTTKTGGGATTNSTLQSRVKALLKEPGNKCCAECRSAKPKWMSLLQTPISADQRMVGVFVCNTCCNFHREGLGDDLCKLKSLKEPDTWDAVDVETLERSGNAAVNAIYQSALEGNHSEKHLGSLASKAFVEDKYKNCQYFTEEAYHEQMELREQLQAAAAAASNKSRRKSKNKGKKNNRDKSNKNKNRDPDSDGDIEFSTLSDKDTDEGTGGEDNGEGGNDDDDDDSVGTDYTSNSKFKSPLEMDDESGMTMDGSAARVSRRDRISISSRRRHSLSLVMGDQSDASNTSSCGTTRRHSSHPLLGGLSSSSRRHSMDNSSNRQHGGTSSIRRNRSFGGPLNELKGPTIQTSTYRNHASFGRILGGDSEDGSSETRNNNMNMSWSSSNGNGGPAFRRCHSADPESIMMGGSSIRDKQRRSGRSAERGGEINDSKRERSRSRSRSRSRRATNTTLSSALAMSSDNNDGDNMDDGASDGKTKNSRDSLEELLSIPTTNTTNNNNNKRAPVSGAPDATTKVNKQQRPRSRSRSRRGTVRSSLRSSSGHEPKTSLSALTLSNKANNIDDDDKTKDSMDELLITNTAFNASDITTKFNKSAPIPALTDFDEKIDASLVSNNSAPNASFRRPSQNTTTSAAGRDSKRERSSFHNRPRSRSRSRKQKSAGVGAESKAERNSNARKAATESLLDSCPQSQTGTQLPSSSKGTGTTKKQQRKMSLSALALYTEAEEKVLDDDDRSKSSVDDMFLVLNNKYAFNTTNSLETNNNGVTKQNMRKSKSLVSISKADKSNPKPNTKGFGERLSVTELRKTAMMKRSKKSVKRSSSMGGKGATSAPPVEGVDDEASKATPSSSVQERTSTVSQRLARRVSAIDGVDQHQQNLNSGSRPLGRRSSSLKNLGINGGRGGGNAADRKSRRGRRTSVVSAGAADQGKSKDDMVKQVESGESDRKSRPIRIVSDHASSQAPVSLASKDVSDGRTVTIMRKSLGTAPNQKVADARNFRSKMVRSMSAGHVLGQDKNYLTPRPAFGEPVSTPRKLSSEIPNGGKLDVEPSQAKDLVCITFGAQKIMVHPALRLCDIMIQLENETGVLAKNQSLSMTLNSNADDDTVVFPCSKGPSSGGVRSRSKSKSKRGRRSIENKEGLADQQQREAAELQQESTVDVLKTPEPEQKLQQPNTIQAKREDADTMLRESEGRATNPLFELVASNTPAASMFEIEKLWHSNGSISFETEKQAQSPATPLTEGNSGSANKASKLMDLVKTPGNFAANVFEEADTPKAATPVHLGKAAMTNLESRGLGDDSPFLNDLTLGSDQSVPTFFHDDGSGSTKQSAADRDISGGNRGPLDFRRRSTLRRSFTSDGSMPSIQESLQKDEPLGLRRTMSNPKNGKGGSHHLRSNATTTTTTRDSCPPSGATAKVQSRRIPRAERLNGRHS